MSLTIIQLFVAQHSPPARFAVAFPWPATGAVLAARIRMTHVAVLSHPAGLAATLARLLAVAVILVAGRVADRWEEGGVFN